VWFVRPLVIGNAVVFRHFLRATRNLSPLGERRYLLVWWLGVWAGRKYFTEDGLRQRNRALAGVLRPSSRPSP
jgi:hypothetical protein